MFARAHWLEADERHLHAGQGTDRVPRRVRHIQTAAETAHEDQGQGVEGNHVGNEDVST